MRQTLLKLAVLALTFALGVGVSVYWQLYQWSLVPYEVSPIPPWPLGAPKSSEVSIGKTDKITVVTSLHACGSEASYHTIQLSDGETISRSYERFPSRIAAERALKTMLANTEIAERSADRDEKGRIISETILVTGPHFMRLKLDGTTLSTTTAPSLRYLQLYEASVLR